MGQNADFVLAKFFEISENFGAAKTPLFPFFFEIFEINGAPNPPPFFFPIFSKFSKLSNPLFSIFSKFSNISAPQNPLFSIVSKFSRFSAPRLPLVFHFFKIFKIFSAMKNPFFPSFAPSVNGNPLPWGVDPPIPLISISNHHLDNFAGVYTVNTLPSILYFFRLRALWLRPFYVSY